MKKNQGEDDHSRAAGISRHCGDAESSHFQVYLYLSTPVIISCHLGHVGSAGWPLKRKKCNEKLICELVLIWDGRTDTGLV